MYLERGPPHAAATTTTEEEAVTLVGAPEKEATEDALAKTETETETGKEEVIGGTATEAAGVDDELTVTRALTSRSRYFITYTSASPRSTPFFQTPENEAGWGWQPNGDRRKRAEVKIIPQAGCEKLGKIESPLNSQFIICMGHVKCACLSFRRFGPLKFDMREVTGDHLDLT